MTMVSPDIKSSSDSKIVVLFLILSSIGSSVSLILLNKYVMKNYGFSFVLTLSSFHFLATAIFSRCAAAAGFFVPKRKAIPPKVIWTMAAAGCASVVFMNFSLEKNSVGFYQMMKLMCIPYMVISSRFLKNVKISVELLFSLILILAGVGIATVTDMEINTEGLIYGVLSVVATAQFQLWQGGKQAEYQLNPLQITDAVIPVQFLLCACMAIVMESNVLFERDIAIEDVEWSTSLIEAIVATCLIAVAVNIVSYALIGKTSAVTYQVVGHLKTVLTLTGGFFLFTSTSAGKGSSMTSNIIGIVLALIGMVFYGDVKSNAKTGDTILQRQTSAPSFWSREF